MSQGFLRNFNYLRVILCNLDYFKYKVEVGSGIALFFTAHGVAKRIDSIEASTMAHNAHNSIK